MKSSRTKPRARDEFSRAEAGAKFIRTRTRLRPQIAVVLGSGLGAFADELESATCIPYALSLIHISEPTRP